MKTILTNITIPAKEIARLSVYLRGWNALNNLFQMGAVLDNDTLEKLITIERNGSNRTDILKRLTARFGKNQMRELRDKLDIREEPAFKKLIKKAKRKP